MVVRVNDPVEWFRNSIEVVKSVFSPLESGIRKSAKNFDFNFPSFIFKDTIDSNTEQKPFAQLTVKDKSSHGFGNRDGGFDGLPRESPVRGGRIGANITVGNVDRKVRRNNNLDLSKFALTWLALFNGFFQPVLSPSDSRRKKIQKTCKQDGPSGVCRNAKEKRLKGRFVMSFCDEGLIQKEEMNPTLDLSKGFLSDLIIHNIQNLDVHDQNWQLHLDVVTVCKARITKLADHLKRLVCIMEGNKRVDANDFRVSMKFERVGGGLPFCSIVGVASSVKVEKNVGNALRVPPRVDISVGSFLKSALAGGIACAMSTALMHPVDTIKTQVQAKSVASPGILSKLPELGIQGLYRGSIPAILGQFFSHGLRTGIFEASKLVLSNVAPSLPDLQVQSVASFCGTFVGTALRIPCEVLKQRLQAGLFDNVWDAVIGTWHQDGLNGFFRGTGATLLREIPFYVAGMGLYVESKKVVQHLVRRELEPWETMAVGAISGGFTAVLTTPIDVIKTRMMTTQGKNLPFLLIAVSIVRGEGPLGLFRGAVPRFFWVAPLGALNFAGYELILKAMDGVPILEVASGLFSTGGDVLEMGAGDDMLVDRCSSCFSYLVPVLGQIRLPMLGVISGVLQLVDADSFNGRRRCFRSSLCRFLLIGGEYRRVVPLAVMFGGVGGGRPDSS